MSSSTKNPKKPLTTTANVTIEMDRIPKPSQAPKSDYIPPLFPSLEQPIELTVNPEEPSSESSGSNETVLLNTEDPEGELLRIDTHISNNYTWYFIYMVLLLILYIVVITLYWTDFVDAPQLYLEETGYFALMLFLAPMWLVGMAIYFTRITRLQTIFTVTLLLCIVLGIILIVADILIAHPSSKLDTATNPKIMVCILVIGPGYLFTKASKLRNEFKKRKRIIDRIEKLKELSNIAKGTTTVDTLSMKHREILVL